MEVADFERFDLILAMDRSNFAALRRLSPDEEAFAKVRLLLEFSPRNLGEVAGRGELGRGDSGRGHQARGDLARGDLDVPDPYHGGEDGFAVVLGLIQGACEGLLDSLLAGEISGLGEVGCGGDGEGGEGRGGAGGEGRDGGSGDSR